MSRSGYSDDCEYLGLWRGTVERAIKGQRGQEFLRELAAAMDAMPDKILIAGELIDAGGNVCAIGAVCKSRGLDVTNVNEGHASEVGELVGIARAMAAEIAFMNDEWNRSESPSERWQRMRKWIAAQITTV